MRKTIIDQEPQNAISYPKLLDIQEIAQVEVTSEDAAFTIEEALAIDGGTGWRASHVGKQTIRIIFDEPQQINSIHLVFVEKQQPRTQEFELRWSPGIGQDYREIVRQQYNFSPESATEEKEDYSVVLEGVKVMELNIVPDINGSGAYASLASWRFV